MTEYRALKRRGNPGGQAIYYGRASVTITGTATSGITTVNYSPDYDTEPYLIVGIPEFSQTASGSAVRVDTSQLKSKTATRFAIQAWIDTAPGSYKTVTLQYDYLVVGEPNA